MSHNNCKGTLSVIAIGLFTIQAVDTRQQYHHGITIEAKSVSVQVGVVQGSSVPLANSDMTVTTAGQIFDIVKNNRKNAGAKYQDF